MPRANKKRKLSVDLPYTKHSATKKQKKAALKSLKKAKDLQAEQEQTTHKWVVEGKIRRLVKV